MRPFLHDSINLFGTVMFQKIEIKKKRKKQLSTIISQRLSRIQSQDQYFQKVHLIFLKEALSFAQLKRVVTGHNCNNKVHNKRRPCWTCNINSYATFINFGANRNCEKRREDVRRTTFEKNVQSFVHTTLVQVLLKNS